MTSLLPSTKENDLLPLPGNILPTHIIQLYNYHKSYYILPMKVQSSSSDSCSIALCEMVFCWGWSDWLPSQWECLSALYSKNVWFHRAHLTATLGTQHVGGGTLDLPCLSPVDR